MNANELADELNTLDRDDWYQWMTEAATMLRQQQAEIADKKLVNDTFADLIKKQGKKIDDQQAEIKRLIGAEPITYGMLTVCKNCGQQNPYFEAKPAKYSDAWWKEVAEFNKKLKVEEK